MEIDSYGDKKKFIEQTDKITSSFWSQFSVLY